MFFYTMESDTFFDGHLVLQKFIAVNHQTDQHSLITYL